MSSLYIFALIGGFIALIPGASFLLIGLEVYLAYTIAKRHDVPLLNGIGIIGALITGSAVLKFFASLFHFALGIGQLANGIFAFAFIVIFGKLVEQFFARQAATQVTKQQQPSLPDLQQTSTTFVAPRIAEPVVQSYQHKPQPQKYNVPPTPEVISLEQCPQCRKQLDPNMVFCAYCGAKVSK